MPKSTKTFVLSNESVNSLGFVIKTAGIDISDFIKNPIMYWLHATPQGKSKDEFLPIGFWVDIKINGNQLIATPNFDDSDEFAMKIYNKVEHGTIRAASVEVDPLTLDNNKANWVKGQTKPTVLTCHLGEASIVDRGANRGAHVLRALGSDGSFIKLSRNPFEADQAQQPDNDTAQAAAPKPKIEHTPATKKVLINAAAAGKLSVDSLFACLDLPTDKNSVANLFDIIKATPINYTGELTGKYHPSILKQATRSYDDINRNVGGGFNDLKKNAPELYKAKMFERFGELPS